jgi:hypothetical protein
VVGLDLSPPGAESPAVGGLDLSPPGAFGLLLWAVWTYRPQEQWASCCGRSGPIAPRSSGLPASRGHMKGLNRLCEGVGTDGFLYFSSPAIVLGSSMEGRSSQEPG